MFTSASCIRFGRTLRVNAVRGSGCFSCVLLIVALSQFASNIVVAQSEELVARLETTAELIRTNRLVEAERELAPVLKAAPNVPVVLNLAGTLRAKQGRLIEAEALFMRAVRGDARYLDARMNLVLLYLLRGATEKAVLELKTVLALQPSNADATAKLAELLIAQRRFDEAIGTLERFKSSQTLVPSLLILLGDAYSSKGELTKAEENFVQALDGRLENAGALLGLAVLAQAKGETRNAQLFIARVSSLTTDSGSPELLYRLAMVALKSEMSDEAKKALERALMLKPNDPQFILALGIAWLRKPDLFEAEKAFRRVLVLQPASVQGQLHLGYVLLNQKKYVEARQWLEKSARHDASVPEVFYYLGLVAQEQNDDAGAVPLFERAIQKLPSYSHVRIALGASLMKLRNYVRAKQELELAVKLDPDEPKAHYNLALLYARLKDPQRAEAEMRIVESLKSKRTVSAQSGVVTLPPPAP